MNRLSVMKKPTKNILLPLLLVSLLGLFFLVSMDAQVVGLTNQDDETETSEQEDEIEDTDEVEDVDDDDDGIEDEEEKANEREIDIETNDDEVKVESQLKVGEKKDEIHIELKTTDEPEIKLEYESESGSTETELEFKIRFYSLIEYNDLDQDKVFNESQDDLVQEIRLDQIEYLPISYRTETLGSNTTLHVINVTSSNGLFSLQFYLTNEFSLVNDALITPTEMKFDIGINDFPYANDSSALALKIRLEAESKYEHDEDTEDENEGRSTNEEEVEVSMNGFTGFFSWIESVTVDGITHVVKSSPVDEDDNDPTEQKIYLNYPRGSHILHDPKVGVAGVLQVVGQSSTPGYLGLVTVLMLAVMSGMITIHRRRR